MRLEDQTCTYEQSKRLVENGVVLDTKFYWGKLSNGEWYLFSNGDTHLVFALKKNSQLPT